MTTKTKLAEQPPLRALTLASPIRRYSGPVLHPSPTLRERPAQSSLALGCFKDGGLLRVRPEPDQTVDGITWLPVATPDGRAGWASAEFLER